MEIPMPAGQVLTHEMRHGVTVSPDGTRIAFVSGPLSGGRGLPRLYVRALDQWDAKPVPESERALSPFFSPDGRSLGFLVPVAAGFHMKRASLSGEAPIVLTEKAERFGATWGSNGRIVFAGLSGGLKWIPDVGGDMQELTQLDTANHEISHRFPHFLPDASAVLFTILKYRVIQPDWRGAQIGAYSFQTGQRKLVIEDATDARYVSGGYLVFAREGKLFVVRFDPSTLSTVGPPMPVLDGVTHSLYGSNSFTQTGAAQFAVSETGALVYAPGAIDPPFERVLVWVDRKSKALTPLGVKSMSHHTARVSRDGKHVLFNEYHLGTDLWTYEIARGTLTRQTDGGQNGYAIWSPDGTRFAFRSSRSGPAALHVKEIATGKITQLTSSPNDTPTSWTPDGKHLALVRVGASATATTSDIYVLSVDDPGDAKPIVNSRFNENYPEFHPEGGWLVYCSDESGASEVYVRRFPGGGAPIRISTYGGAEPAWSPDGTEIFYRTGPGLRPIMMAVRVKIVGDDLIPEPPVKLFEGDFNNALGARSYDVAPDGRFLMVKLPTPEQTEERQRKILPPTLHYVVNWTTELARRMPAR
jgi:serine/threonine-protein kinase